ncbi:unknown [Clostridium sp. CAG:451]|nr:unknown [Clostridium sp. CAG:451]
MNKWIKENKIILITVLIFETYIGICIAAGMYLMSHKVK